MSPTHRNITGPAATPRTRLANFLLAAAGATALVAPDGAQAIPFSNSASGGTVLIAASGGDYSTLAAAGTAFTAVSGGINGDWNILVANGAYTEPVSAAFGNTVASGKTVTLRPAPGATVSINFSATAANAGIDGGLIIGGTNLTSLDGHTATNNFIVDGCNTPGGTTRNLTLSNTAASFGQSVIRVHGASSNGVIRNCVITNNGTGGTSSYGILLTSRLTVTNFIPNNWTVRNNVINSTGGSGSAAQGIGCSNSGTITSGNAQTGHLFTGNTISARTRGIFLNQNAGCTISNNTIRVNQDVAGSSSMGIYHLTANSASGWTINITGNRLDQLQTSATAANNGITAMDFSAAGGGTYNVSSNMICGFGISQATATDLICRGIFVGSTVSPNLNVFNNSINIPAFAGVSGATPERAGAVIVSNTSYSGTFTCRNNIIRVATSGATNASTAICKLGSSGTFTANNDVIFVSGTVARSGYVNTTGYVTLASFQAAGFEAVGQSLDPLATYGSAWLGNLDLRFSTALGLRPIGLRPAVPISGVTSDIDGEARHASYPFPGCDEMTNSGAFAWFAMDNASYSAYNTSWDNTTNGGFGWGGTWARFTSGASGTFVGKVSTSDSSISNGAASDSNSDGDVNTSNSSTTTAERRAWGAFANSGGQIDMIRPFPRDMTASDVVRAQFDNGTVQTGPPAGGVGISIRNGSGNNIFEVYFQGGQANYFFNDSLSNTINSGLAYSDQGIDVQFQLTGAGTYTCTIVRLVDGVRVTRSGTLIAATGGTVPRDIRFWNYTAGSLAAPNAYFNNMSLGDNTPPTATLSGPAFSSSASISYTLNFNEAVTTVTGSMFTVVNGTAGTVTGSGTGPYTVPVTATNQGPVTVTLPGGAAVDAGGAGNAASNTVSTVFDNVAPTVLGITPVGATTTNSTSLLYNVAFSEPVSGVTAGAFSLTYGTGVSGGVVGTPYSTKGGLTWVVPVTGVVSTQQAGGTARLDLGTVTGISDGINTLASTFNAGTAVTVDQVGPTVVSITRNGAAQNSNAGTISFLVTFSEPMTTSVVSGSFVTSGTTSGAAIGTLTGTNGTATRTLTVTNSTNTAASVGTAGVRMTLVSGAADMAGNTVTGLPFNNPAEFYNTDRQLPLCTSVTRAFPPAGQDTSNTITWQFDFGEPITGFNPTVNGYFTTEIGLFGLSGFVLNPPSSTAQASSWQITFTGVTGDGRSGAACRYQGGAVDLFGNVLNINFTNAATWTIGTTQTIDNTAPTVALTSTAPANTNVSPIPVTATFSEGVLNFDASDIVASGATVSGFTTVTSGVYTFNLVPTADGVVTCNVAAGAASDKAYNFSTAATQLSRTYDATPPSVAISAPSDTITQAGSVTYTVVYTDATTITLSPANVVLNRTGTAVAGTTVTVSGAGDTTRVVSISNLSGDGTVGISILAGTAFDAAGNLAAAAGPSATFTVDNTPPTVAFGVPSTTLTNTGPIDFPVNYTGATSVTLAPGDVTVTKNGTADYTGLSILGSGTAARTIRLTGITGDGSLAVSVAGATAFDSATNVAPAAGPSLLVFVDNTAPGVVIGSPSPSVTSAGPVDFIVTYTGASAVTLGTGDITLNATGTAAGTVSVIGSGTATRTVRVSGITGDGSLGISIAGGTASDLAGNTALAAGPSDTFGVGNSLPAVDISAPTPSITRTSDITFTVTYSNYTAITLTLGNVSVVPAGGAAGFVSSVTGSGATRTVTVSGIVGNGTMGIALAANTATNSGQPAPAATSPLAVVDNTAPTVSVSPPDRNPITTGPVSFDVFFSEPVTGFTTSSVTVNRGGTVGGGTVSVSGSGTSYTVALTALTGDGTVGITVNPAAASDVAGNASLPSAPSAPSVVDNTAPVPTVGAPVPAVASLGNVSFPVLFNEPVTGFSLESDLQTTATGTASYGSATVLGSGTTYTITLSGVSGDGTIVVGLKARVAVDAAGNPNAASAASGVLTLDNTAPTVVIGAPSASLTRGGPVTFTVTYSDNVGLGAITLNPAGVTLNSTGNATGTVGVTGSGNTRTVTISSITGDGTLGISIAGGTATDTAGNAAADAGPSATFTVDNTAPTIAIGAASEAVTNGGPVTYTVTYTGADAIILAPGDVTLNVTGTAVGLVAVTGSGNTRTVTISSITGDGTLGISLAPGTATDAAGNLALPAGPSATFTVDNLPPTVAIGAPSVTATRNGPVTYTVTYTGASAITLGPVNVILNATGTANGIVSVLGAGNTRTVRVSSITGDGTLGISLAPGTATDAAGNLALPAGPSATFTVDNTAPTVAIGAPSVSATQSGPVTFTVTYTGSTAVTLANGDVTLNATGTAAGTVAVTGSGATRTVTISSITGDGTLGISLAAGTATDAVGNLALAAGPSGTFTVDNTAPTVAIGAPSASATKSGPVTFTVTYTGSSAVTLATGDVTLNTTGNANGTVAVTGSGATRTVTVSSITGDGTLGISLAAGTASDAVGNLALAAGPSATFAVDNSVPSSSASAPVDWTLVGPSVAIGFTASDSGVGLASTELYVKAPGSASFAATGLTLTGGSGSFTYTFGAGGGYYQFATRATDTVGNVQAAPASGTATVVVNPTANAALSIPVATGTSVTVVYPMTSVLDVTLTFANVTVAGTASVSRSQPRAAAPAYFQVPASLLNESLTVTGGGGLAFGTASLAWQYDPANAPAQPIGNAWKFDGGATPTATFTVTPAANTLTLNGITGFSDFFAGSAVAVPVTVSGFEAE